MILRIMRHANAGPATVDFDRELTPKGNEQAAGATSTFGDANFVLSSSAPRAIQTARRGLGERNVPLRVVPGLYNSELLARLDAIGEMNMRPVVLQDCIEEIPKETEAYGKKTRLEVLQAIKQFQLPDDATIVLMHHGVLAVITAWALGNKNGSLLDLVVPELGVIELESLWVVKSIPTTPAS